MDPTRAFCPNLACAARGPTGQGNIGIHSRKDQRFNCTECHKTCTATKGPALYRLRTSAEIVSLVVTLIAHGCPWQAVVVAFDYDERWRVGWHALASKGRRCSRIWWNTPAPSAKCKPMRYASNNRAASCGWRWP